MNRLDNMLERLPPIYRIAGGSLLHGVASLAANHQAAYDEDMHRVQRSHWLDTALDRDDLAKIGALFDVPIMPWEPDELYRTRLRATIAARLRGAVTRDDMEFVLIQILNGVLESLRVRYIDLSPQLRFHTGPGDDPREPAFVEFPPVLRRSSELTQRSGLLRSLEKFKVVNRGLHPVPLQVAIRGVAGGLCLTPVLINLTNGRVLAFAGSVLCGQELRVLTGRRAGITAMLNDRDVAPLIYTGGGFVPGAKFSPVVPDSTPEPLLAERGVNEMWFFPLALYDRPSLGSGVFAMPVTETVHGRFGGKSETPFSGTHFDSSLFEQSPAAVADLWWEEAEPANFRFEIPAGVVVRQAAMTSDAHEDRLRLFSLLQQTISSLRAAGVNGRVEPRPLRDVQRERDRVYVTPTIAGKEEVRMDDKLSGLSALFDLNATEGSRFA